MARYSIRSVSVPSPFQVSDFSDEVESLLALCLQHTDLLLKWEARVSPQPKELCGLLQWQKCVSNPHYGGSLSPRPWCSEMYDFALVGCKPEAIPCRPFLYVLLFTACCRCLSTRFFSLLWQVRSRQSLPFGGCSYCKRNGKTSRLMFMMWFLFHRYASRWQHGATPSLPRPHLLQPAEIVAMVFLPQLPPGSMGTLHSSWVTCRDKTLFYCLCMSGSMPVAVQNEMKLQVWVLLPEATGSILKTWNASRVSCTCDGLIWAKNIQPRDASWCHKVCGTRFLHVAMMFYLQVTWGPRRPWMELNNNSIGLGYAAMSRSILGTAKPTERTRCPTKGFVVLSPTSESLNQWIVLRSTSWPPSADQAGHQVSVGDSRQLHSLGWNLHSARSTGWNISSYLRYRVCLSLWRSVGNP